MRQQPNYEATTELCGISRIMRQQPNYAATTELCGISRIMRQYDIQNLTAKNTALFIESIIDFVGS